MATQVPCNNGTTYVVKYEGSGVSQEFTSTSKLAKTFLAANISAVIPETTKYAGAPYACIKVVVSVPTHTQPDFYWFNTTSLTTFASFLSGLSITNTLVVYPLATKINGAPTFNGVPTSILLNSAKEPSVQYEVRNDTTIVTVSWGNYPAALVPITFVGNQTGTGTSATATLAVPILATPANGDTLIAKYNGVQVGSTLTVSGSPSQATIKAAVDALYNALGFTATGVLAANVDTLTITAPVAGTTYNNQHVSFERTGTTFGATNVSATFLGGA